MRADDIASALTELSKFNKVIFANDESVLFDVIKYIAKYGHSLTFARKLAFVFGYVKKETQSFKVSSEILSTYGLQSNYGVMSVVDSIGFDFDYLSLKSSFDEYSAISEHASISQRLAYLSFHPIQLDRRAALDGLLHLSFDDRKERVIILTQYPTVEYDREHVPLSKLKARLLNDEIGNVLDVVLFSQDGSWAVKVTQALELVR